MLFEYGIVKTSAAKYVLVGSAEHAVVAGAVRAANDDSEHRHLRARHGRHHFCAIFRDADRLRVAFHDEAYSKKNQGWPDPDKNY